MNKFDTIFKNCQIWQKDCSVHNTWLAVKDGVIAEYGNNENVPADSHAEKVVDVENNWVFPGLHDCHMHGDLCGLKTNPLKFLKHPKSIREFKENLAKMVGGPEKHGQWLKGYGWDDEIMDRYPNKFDIDQVCSDRPIILYRICYHILVANSKALEICKVMPDGVLEVFPDGHEHAGQLTGVLKEYQQHALVTKHMPEETSEEKQGDIMATLNELVKCGVTSVHVQDAGCWPHYKYLAEENKLPINCYLAPSFKDQDIEGNFPDKPVKRLGKLQCDTVKVFIDGALRAQTAALSLPYVNTDKENNLGMLQYTEEELLGFIDRINRRGFRLEIHTIGDRAADVALNCLEKAGVPPQMRPIFVHCQILRDDLIDRMVKQGACTSIQPSFAPSDYSFVKNHLPQHLQKYAYTWKTFAERGVRIGGSSDAPVEDINPLTGIYDVIFRKTAEGEVFNADECFTFDEAVELYTTKSAYVDGVESFRGKIERGFDADLVVMETPIDENTGIPVNLNERPELLKMTKVQMTYVKGELAYQA